MATRKHDLIGTAETAAILGVHQQTVITWARNGRLTPAVKMPGTTGAILFHRADVEALRVLLQDTA
jgi:excisionase family DNA binding protein